jgi:arginine decarboxylase
MFSQRAAPVLAALRVAKASRAVGFGAPGHGRGQGATPDVLRLIGREVFDADLITLKGLDDRVESLQALQKAHALAAKAWGARLCRFGTGGSTQNLHCALAAVAKPGDTVLVAANCHKAEFAAAIFAGLSPVVVPVTPDADWDLEHGVAVSALAAALDAHPDAKAVVVVSPTYFGVTSDIASLAKLCHDRHVPLIVDAAWGAAFDFHPELPKNPIRLGADVAVVSVHKTMAALSQGSALLVGGALVDPERVALAYELFETTSPSVPILASLDATRREHALHGRRIWSRVLRLARRARARLAEIDGVRVLGRERLDGDGAFDLDETKITLDLSGLGVSVYDADDWLVARHGVSLGLSDARHALAVLSVGTTARDVAKLLAAVRALAREARRHPERFRKPAPQAPHYRDLGVEMVTRAADAFAGPTELVAYEAAAGRVAAEIIAPAPPGVPRLIPGQRITAAHVAFLAGQREAGMFVLDPADQSERRLRVVKEASA